MAYLEYFPEEVIALQRELQNHPKILEKLHDATTQRNVEWSESLGIIAAEMGIILDGIYDPIDLCKMLLRKLKEKSSLIVVADPSMRPVQIRESKDSVIIEPAPKSKQPR